MKTLTDLDIQNFWIRVYLGTTNKEKLKEAAIDRAYRDFNRTMRGIREIQNDCAYGQLRTSMLKITEEVVTLAFSDQVYFDNWHLDKCNELKQAFIDILNFKITHGQAQKWINMSLKYMFALGEEVVQGITSYYHFFHIPIDNIIQNKLESYNIDKLSIKWSKLDNYEDYQYSVRERFLGQIPLEVELKLFNQ